MKDRYIYNRHNKKNDNNNYWEDYDDICDDLCWCCDESHHRCPTGPTGPTGARGVTGRTGQQDQLALEE